jgi:hypothetical protein
MPHSQAIGGGDVALYVGMGAADGGDQIHPLRQTGGNGS